MSILSLGQLTYTIYKSVQWAEKYCNVTVNSAEMKIRLPTKDITLQNRSVNAFDPNPVVMIEILQ